MIGILGIVILMVLAWLWSPYKRDVSPRLIVSALLLQFLLAILFLKTSVGEAFFSGAQGAADLVLSFSDAGARFLFSENFAEHFFAFKVLPTVIFVASLSQILFYYGVMQKVVNLIGVVMQKTLKISGAEATVTAANIFLGQIEAPLFVKPYIPAMTKSELNVLMNSGMATVAGGVLAAYVGMGISAGHLLAASFMAAPASILISKLMLPERESPLTLGGNADADVKSEDTNVFEAAVSGASEGLSIALNIGAVLIAFVGLVAMFNAIIGWVGAHFFNIPLSFEIITGTLFKPLAWVMGVPWEEAGQVGQLFGKKVILNEFIAYQDLGQMIKNQTISAKAEIIATYSLCGFANFSSIAMQIGGVGAIAPSRRKDLAKLGLVAMVGGNLAAFMTGTIAGLFL